MPSNTVFQVDLGDSEEKKNLWRLFSIYMIGLYSDSTFYKNKLAQEYDKNNPYRLAIFYLKDREQEEKSYLQGYLQLSKVDVKSTHS